MDTIRLRTLTLKSVVGFGKYTDSTVGQVLGLNRTGYLRWIYYNMSGISFMPEVLEKIFIHPWDEIDKPGKDPEKCTKVASRMYAIASSKGNSMKMSSRLRKMRKIQEYRTSNSRKYLMGKELLQRKNQGHN